MATFYKCANIGNCETADKGDIIRLEKGLPPKCPQCGKQLILAKSAAKQNQNNTPILMGMVLVLLLLLGGGAYFVSKNMSPSSEEQATPLATTAPKPAASTPPATQATTVLRFHGSNTIGGKLLPALATAYLQQKGCQNLQKQDVAEGEESQIVGNCKEGMQQINIAASGSKTAFDALKDDLADIGMSSRPIKAEEQQVLLPILGNLTANASEHVLALDGIAVIVHTSNPIKTLSLQQLADIFSCTITNWSQLGGQAGIISLYTRDEKSGTYDFFKEAVLNRHGKRLASTAQRFEDSKQLADAVTLDTTGIGFISFNYVGANKVIALSDTGVDARKPSLLTIKTEDYLLSRRLYLYNAEKSTNPNVRQFIEFAESAAAQPVIAATGLVNLDLTPIAKTPEEQSDEPRAKSATWRKLTANANAEMSTRFHFRAGSSELDSRANRDIGRVSGVAQEKYADKSLILLGFSDSSGARTKNCELSQNRADIVKQELAIEGLRVQQVIGLCDDAPIAPNDTPENKEKNRRVEVWVE